MGGNNLSGLGYYPFNRYLRARFGCKVHKVSLHAGFTCPNRDGTVAVGGCSYCANESFSPAVGRPVRTISEQMREGMDYMRRRFNAQKFLAYLQSFSNTYAPVDRLRAVYDEATAFDDVVGLCIGTRPDCVPEPVLDLIHEYTRRLDVWVEYGLQSANDETLKRVNRGHDVACFLDAVARTAARGIHICVHIILGLPGEDLSDMMRTADMLATIPISGIKLHHLYIARGTAMEADYFAGKIRLFTAEEYVSAACDFLERIPAYVTIQRLCGDTTSEGILLAPQWPYSKTQLLTMITQEFARRKTRQGASVANERAAKSVS